MRVRLMNRLLLQQECNFLLGRSKDFPLTFLIFKRRNLFKKKEVINYLELTPVREKKFIVRENGIVTVLIPKFKSPFFQKLIPKNKSRDIKISFDELGSAVWSEIDGNKKVDDIVKILGEKLGEKIHPAEERITKFLTQLNSHKFLSFKELNKE